MKGMKKADVNETGLRRQHACGVPPLRGRQYPRFTDACGQKGTRRVRGSTKTCKVLLVNYTHVMETGVLVPYGINTLW